ncbi:PREDICTED: filament plant [Prunus dulcis]|uniref:PREDICTED: filament plant n=1 Tax=Prunus dulcis TaxID=3755 RepID=A0A5E4ERC4_PRUDU|nr:PREDICTED: filament plant [Prunus dulcis]
MDQKAWLWRKRSSEKTILATNAIPLGRIEEEIQTYPTEKGNETERSGKNLNEKLASVLLDCHVKEDLVTEHAKTAEAIAGGKKAGEPVLKQELDQALRQGISANERLTHSDDALAEYKQQLNFVREEQEQRINDAVMMTAREYEKAQKKLEEKLRETSQQLTNLALENTNLNKALRAKEKLIEDLNRHKSRADAEFSALMARLDSTEKENAFLRYEFHMLEKELEIRSEEMEYNRRSAEESHKQLLESVRKITKLEQECQRLHLLMRKRLPGPTTLLNMKSEVQMLGRDQTEMRRRKLNPTRDIIVRDANKGNSPEIPNKKMRLMIEQLHDLEEENKTLKEILIRKNSELLSSRTTHSQTASRLSQAGTQLGQLSKGQKSMELVACSPIPNDISRSSRFDIGSDDGISSSESWASALISELEHFKNERLKSPKECREVEVSDISLMDDFVQMEKMAIVSAVTPPNKGHHRCFTGRELVPVEVDSSFSDRRKYSQSKDARPENSFDWLQVVLKAMLEQKNVSNRSLDELFEDIKIALGYINQPTNHEAHRTAVSGHRAECDPIDSFSGALSIDTSVEDNGSQRSQSSLSKSISKLIKLFQGINQTSLVYDCTTDVLSYRDQSSQIFNSAASTDYLIRIFQWKRSELNAVVEKCVLTCHNLLGGKANFENFVEELTSTLDWLLNDYRTPKDASTMRNKIKKHFGWQEDQGDIAVEGAIGESIIGHTSEEQSLCLPLVASSNDQDVSLNKVQDKLQEENGRLKDELKSMEAQLKESQQIVESLQSELESLKQSEGIMEDQIENQKSVNEDLDTQLNVTKAKLNEVFQKFSSLEAELEHKHSCCEDLEATCLELQLQLQSAEKKETPEFGINQEEKQSQSCDCSSNFQGWEITTASVKLAECQETILNLGKQLKALATPREAELFDKVFSTTTSTAANASDNNLNRRSSLRDQMLAEDNPRVGDIKSPKEKETQRDADAEKPSLLHSDSHNALSTPTALMREGHLGSRHKAGNSAVGSLAIVPSKKQGGFGLLRRLLLRRKKGSNKKPQSLAKA